MRRIAGSAVSLWLAFTAVHVWLGFLNLYGPGLPMGDVTYVYLFWVERGLTVGEWVGLDTEWVYPVLALVPMLAAYAFGPDLYASTWLTIIMALNAIALVSIIGVHERARRAPVAWWWMLFLVLLGPIALGRIDAVTVPLAIVAVMLLVDHPKWSGALLAIGAWIKVWPAALVLAAVIALRARAAVAVSVGAVSGVVVALALPFGSLLALVSPITQQGSRGVQVEAVVATPWLWAAAAGVPGTRIYYDQGILTWQALGEGTSLVADLMTPLLALAVLGVVVLGIITQRRGVAELDLFPVLSLALVMTLIVVNKVGSPQFATWIAVPVVLGLAWQRRGGISFTVPAVLGLVIAGLTQSFYPVQYGALLSLEPALLAALTARNVLYLVLLGWALQRLAVLCKRPPVALAARRVAVDEGGAS